MPTPTSPIRQAGVIPLWGDTVCVITSRSGRRWVLPKGCLEPGKTAGEIALQEAWEEAGLIGVLSPEPVGTYTYEKAGFTCLVTVFVLHVTEVAQEWPEQAVRRRVWLSPEQTIPRLEEDSLKELVRSACGLAAEPVVPLGGDS